MNKKAKLRAKQGLKKVEFQCGELVFFSTRNRQYKYTISMIDLYQRVGILLLVFLNVGVVFVVWRFVCTIGF